jgi:hypothetical protein
MSEFKNNQQKIKVCLYGFRPCFNVTSFDRASSKPACQSPNVFSGQCLDAGIDEPQVVYARLLPYDVAEHSDAFLPCRGIHPEIDHLVAVAVEDAREGGFHVSDYVEMLAPYIGQIDVSHQPEVFAPQIWIGANGQDVIGCKHRERIVDLAGAAPERGLVWATNN